MAQSGERDFAVESDWDENKEDAAENQGNVFDRIMFGHGTGNRQLEEEASMPGKFDQGNNANNQINLEEVMVHIDTLIDSARQLKPMFSKIRPLFDQFLKK